MDWLPSLLALLLVFSVVYPSIGVAALKTVVVFQSDETKVSYNGDVGEKAMSKPLNFRFPSLVGGMIEKKEFLAVISSASLNESTDFGFDGVVSTSYGNHTQWNQAEVFTNKTNDNKKRLYVETFTSVMKGSNIYVLAHSFGIQNATKKANISATAWDVLLFVGTINDPSDSAAGGPSITWKEGKSLKTELQQDLQKENATYFVGAAGNGIVTKKDAIVFPIRMDQPGNKHMSSILYSTDDGKNWKCGGKIALGNHDGSVVEWGVGKLLLNVPSDNGYRSVFESDDMGTTWKESSMFSRVWGYDPDRKKHGFPGSAIKVPMEGKDVLLFAHPVNESRSSTDTLQLWLSDGTRIVCVGTISEKGNKKHYESSILAHVGDHLYITHEINPINSFNFSKTKLKKGNGVIGFTSLSEYFESAKTTVRGWCEMDKWFLSKGVPTEGLVGFLGNATKDNSVWEDKYQCVHATVKGVKSVDGGFQFNGSPGSGAKWPVVSQGQNQVYQFTREQFTLAATLKIHSAGGNNNVSLLGASNDAQGNNILIGIGYTKNKKWYKLNGKESKTLTEDSFVLNKEYHIALTFASGVANIYLDGLNIIKETQMDKSDIGIDHFFMGSGGLQVKSKGSDFTIKNVMLFNRSLKEKEIAQLSTVSKNGNLDEPISNEKINTLPVSQKSPSPTKPNSTSGVEQKMFDDVLQDHHKATVQKHNKRSDSSLQSFALVQVTCVMCAIILLAGV